jgi:methionine aminotransferase
VRSKFPQAGTTVFSVMSQLAQQYAAVNLGQGFPDFAPDNRLLDNVGKAMSAGLNQYAPMTGLTDLRRAVSEKISAFGGLSYDPDHEITITAGATEALTSSILALVHPGDAVLVFEPVYDSYAPAIALAGGQTVRVRLDADFRPDWPAVQRALTPAVRGIIINTPHNPSATVWSSADFHALRLLCREHDWWVISDEVYEHMVFDEQAHRSVAHCPELMQRSVLVSSFGKSLHVTGWKIAYAAAPARMSHEIRLVHQYNTFSVATPLQAAIATYLGAHGEALRQLPGFYQRKRDHFRNGLKGLPLRVLPCEATYFQVVDYSALSESDDQAFSRWLTEHIGVACIPLSAFYETAPDMRCVRFCFAKQDATLDEALRRLQRLK